ncbi:MAG: hypothetical protein ACQKBT_02445 [Puniceicoccales bacterium]
MLPEEDQGIVLHYTEKGEKFWSITFLSRSHGLYHPMVRKTRTGTRPDLFDTAQAGRAKAKQGELIFLSDYYPIRRRTGIARSYEVLRIASRFAEILRRNAQHLPDCDLIFQMSERFFDSLQSGPSPLAAYLKTLYLFAKTEGFPIRESWVPQLGNQYRTDLETVLKNPLNQQPEEPMLFKTLSASLEQWLVDEAHFVIPHQKL